VDCASARNARRCRVDGQDSASQALTIQAFNGGFEVPRVLKFNKTEASGVAGNPITYHLSERNGVTVLFEPAL